MSRSNPNDAPPSPAAASETSPVLTWLLAALPALVLGIASGFLCWAVAGVSLGLFFGGVAFATMLVPPLTAGEPSTRRRILVPLAASAGVALVWLTALGDLLRPTQWLACSTALLAYAFALGGTCAILIAIRVAPLIAAAVVTVTGMLWLTWPVWLSAVLTGPAGGTLAGWLVPAHPLFAINGVLRHFDTWDRYPLAYSRLTVLNQDVFYALPSGVVWAGLVHGLVATAGFALAGVLETRRQRRSTSPREETA